MPRPLDALTVADLSIRIALARRRIPSALRHLNTTALANAHVALGAALAEMQTRAAAGDLDARRWRFADTAPKSERWASIDRRLVALAERSPK